MFEKSVDLELMKIFYDSGLSTKEAFNQAWKLQKQLERESRIDRSVTLNSVNPAVPVIIAITTDSLVSSSFTAVKSITYIGASLVIINTTVEVYKIYESNGNKLSKDMFKTLVSGAISVFFIAITPGVMFKLMEVINEGCKFALPFIKREIVG